MGIRANVSQAVGDWTYFKRIKNLSNDHKPLARTCSMLTSSSIVMWLVFDTYKPWRA